MPFLLLIFVLLLIWAVKEVGIIATLVYTLIVAIVVYIHLKVQDWASNNDDSHISVKISKVLTKAIRICAVIIFVYGVFAFLIGFFGGDRTTSVAKGYCSACGGSGIFFNRICANCNGSGKNIIRDVLIKNYTWTGIMMAVSSALVFLLSFTTFDTFKVPDEETAGDETKGKENRLDKPEVHVSEIQPDCVNVPHETISPTPAGNDYYLYGRRVDEDTMISILENIDNGKRLDAITIIRRLANVGLSDAKLIVDNYDKIDFHIPQTKDTILLQINSK